MYANNDFKEEYQAMHWKVSFSLVSIAQLEIPKMSAFGIPCY